jgi:exoribonuclease R
MLDARVGVLRTLPPPSAESVAALHRVAGHLGLDWAPPVTLSQALSALDRSAPESLALLRAATRLLRGVGYAAFDGAAPQQTGHAGIGSPYAHVTAPLRRLVDRFGTEVCLAVTAGAELPGWLRTALPSLPEVMAASDAIANKVDRACVDAAEVAVLAGRVGERFDALVLRAPEGDDEKEAGEVYVLDPPVLARCTGKLTAGARAGVRLTEADPVARRVSFHAD